MFKWATATSLTLIALIGAFWTFRLCVIRESDREYLTSKLHNEAVASSENAHYGPTNQMRREVRKDFWLTQDDESRLHYRIESEQSVLTLTPIKNHFDVVESLKGIRCWMQDKLYRENSQENLMQQARFFQAKDGIYRYTSQEFLAKGVSLSLFRLPGHSLPEEMVDSKQAFLRGIARDVSFTFSGKTPHFQAGEFKATLVKSNE